MRMRGRAATYLATAALLSMVVAGSIVASAAFGNNFVPRITGVVRSSIALLTIAVLAALIIRSIMRELEQRRLRLQAKSVQTINEEIDARVVLLFTNQERALSAFRRILQRDDPSQKVLSINGVSGVGKSWILRYYKHIAENDGYLVTYVDGTVISSQLEILSAISREMRASGRPMPTYEQRLERHQQVHTQVDSKTGSLESATKLVLRLGASTLPSASTLVNPGAQEEFLSLIQDYLSQSDRELYLNPEESLTSAALSDLNAIAEEQPLLLLVDSHDRLTQLDSWLRQFVEQLSSAVPVVIAGQIPLSRAWNQLGTVTTSVWLEGFDRDAARSCLARYAGDYRRIQLDADQQERILTFAGGLPLAINWCVDLMAKYSVTDFREVQSEAVAHLAQTMLEVASPKVQTLVEECAVPRWVNEDLLEQLDKEWEPREAYRALADLPFIRRVPEGLAFHDQVRWFTNEILRQRSPERYASLHNTCASFHRSQLRKFVGTRDIDTSLERRSVVELVYHTFMLSEQDGLKLLSEVVNEGLEFSRLDYCESLLLEARTHSLGPDANDWVQYWTAELAYRRGKWSDALSLLETLIPSLSTSQPVYVATRMTLGRIYYQHGSLDEASNCYDEALNQLHQSDSSQLRGYVTEQLAKVRRMEGDLAGALELHNQALEYSIEQQNKYAIASGLGSRGTTLLLLGQLHEGVDSLGQGATAGREEGYIQFACSALRSKSIGLTYLGRYKDAEREAVASLEIAERIGDAFNIGFANLALGEVFLRTDRKEQCAAALTRAIREFTAVGARFDLGNSYVALGSFHLSTAEVSEASLCFEQASRLFTGTRFRYGLAWLHLWRARMWGSSGRLDKRMEDATKAFNEAEIIGATYVSAWARLERIATLIDSGDSNSVLDELSLLIVACQANGFQDIASRALLRRIGILQLELKDPRESADLAFEALASASRHSVVTFVQTATALSAMWRETRSSDMRAYLLERWIEEGVDGVPGMEVEARLKKSLSNYPFSALSHILT